MHVLLIHCVLDLGLILVDGRPIAVAEHFVLVLPVEFVLELGGTSLGEDPSDLGPVVGGNVGGYFSLQVL